MKQRSIPAQITTVEDRIAGNLNLTQIVLLMVPIFWLMVVYAVLPQAMRLTTYKIPLIVLVTLVSCVLALRIKGKVMLHWLVILLKYNTRPMYYVYDKNDSSMRSIYLPVFKKRQIKLFPKKKISEVKTESPNVSIAQLVQLQDYVANPKFTLSIRSSKRGGVHVAFEQNKK